ncbi:MAG: glycosyltransferase family 2 protein [Chloroflexota bacterium]
MITVPKISIVTPAYNSEKTIEATMLSVLQQGYPNTEYIVVDGGSDDRTPKIIEQYADELHYWVSEPDNGMYDGLQKGFDKSTGEIMGWLNSDDVHNPHTLAVVSQIFQDLPDVEWITSLYPVIKTPAGHPVDVIHLPGYHKTGFMRGEYSGVGKFIVGHIQQESTFWRRSLWEKAGGSLDTSLKLAGDFELWMRFFQHAELIGVRTVLGGITRHPQQRSHLLSDVYVAEEHAIMHRYGGKRHTALSAGLRHLGRYLDRPFTRLLVAIGARHETRIAVYSFRANTWYTKPAFV